MMEKFQTIIWRRKSDNLWLLWIFLFCKHAHEYTCLHACLLHAAIQAPLFNQRVDRWDHRQRQHRA